MNTTACIFNIQKFSIHDGPGIRTTVFFKGCPLRCKWCANPESIRPERQILWGESACILCGHCIGACAEGAVAINDATVSINYHECRRCGDCVDSCPKGALSFSGEEYTLDQVVAICLQDKDFYDESGGGVTLSGGEVTLQADFALQLINRLKHEGIHVALETNGYAAGDIFQKLANAADLLLFDIKHHDPEMHRRGTGVDNKRILDNLAWAVKQGLEVLPRIPIIPNYNNRPADAVGFAEVLKRIGLDTVQLLPFHQFGQNKYRMLGMAYELGDLPGLRKEELEGMREIMLDAGLREVKV